MFTLLLSLTIAAPPSGQPWQQWGGPDRDFAVDQTLGSRAPEQMWTRPLGPGHGQVVTDGAGLFTTYRDGARESVVRFDADTGATTWTQTFDVRGDVANASYPGPHATPLVTDDLLVTATIDGQIQAWDLASGERRWRRDLVTEFRTDLPQAGYAASPVRWNDLVILPGLGARAPGAIALDLATGTTRWARHAFLASHASPTVIRFDDRDLVVFHGMNRLVGLDPSDGDHRFTIWLREDAIDNVAFPPLWDAPRRQFILSHGYDRVGARAVRLERDGDDWRATEVWTNGRLKIEHGNGVVHDGVFYGSAGAFIAALDARTGRQRFKQRGVSEARVLVAGDHLLVQSEDGGLSLMRATAKTLETIWSIEALDSTAWTVPTVLDDRIIVRNHEEVRAYRISGARP